MRMWQVKLTTKGYLHLPAALARQYFPSDLLMAFSRGAEVWLLPLRGPGAGGLVLKQRNRAGDRSVLVAELLPPGTSPGPRQSFWDERAGALRVVLIAREDPIDERARPA